MGARAVGRRLTLMIVTSLLASMVAVAAEATTEEDPEDLPAPAVTMVELEPADFADTAAALPPDLIAAIERDLGLTAEQYLAGAAAARRADDVIAALGDIVTAAWLDGQTLHVAVESRADERFAAATGARVHVGDALTDAVRAARSQGRVAYIDRSAGRVVPVEAEIVGAQARITRLSPRPEQSGGGTVRGGLGYWTHDALTAYQCTAGFTGVTANGASAALTAGHCAEGESGLRPGFGGFADESVRFGEGHDAAILDISNDAWQARPEVAAMAGDEQGPAIAIHDAINAVPGAPACASGAATGWTCGTVLDTASEIPVRGAQVTGFLLKACSLPGDGGGPVVIGNYALGIVSGTSQGTGNCTESGTDESTPVTVGYALVGNEHSALELFGGAWSLGIGIGTPEVTAPVEGDVAGALPTIRGHIDAASGATVVVTMDDGERAEAEVQPDGRWRAPLTQPLPPGRHTYQVTARHTARAADEPVVSRTVTGSFEVADTAALVVITPEDHEVIAGSVPRFSGKGEPGARITVELGGRTTAGVVDDDGGWALAPRTARVAGRFDVVVTQHVDGAPEQVTVQGIGIVPGAPLVAGSDEDVPHDVVTGSAVPGSTVEVRVQPALAAEAGEPATVVGDFAARTGRDGVWQVNLNGLAPGSYLVSAVQTVDDLISERSASMAVDVMGSGVRAADAADDLARTGVAPMPLILAGVVAFATGCAALLGRRRHMIASR